MSLGLFAATVVLLQQHKALSVDRLAHLLAVQEDQVKAVLRDIHSQGHCILFISPRGELLRATWRDHVPEGWTE